MSKTNGRMHIVALQSTIGSLEADKLALSQALAELGYCHDQQTAFITASMSGADGLICKDILLGESKAALAEAVETNKQLTDDLEFQAHRYGLLQNEVRSRSLALVGAEQENNRLKARVNMVLTGGRIVAAVLALAVAGLAVQLAGVF